MSDIYTIKERPVLPEKFEMSQILPEIIPSTDVLNEIRNSNMKFSDTELLELIENSHITRYEKNHYLKLLMESSSNNDIIKNINNIITLYTSIKNNFLQSSESCISELYLYDVDDSYRYGFFMDPLDAYKYGLRSNKKFKITKFPIIGKEFIQPAKDADFDEYVLDEGNHASDGFEYSYIEFDEYGREDDIFHIDMIDGAEVSDIRRDCIDAVNNVSNTYVKIPYPFNRGDIVKSLNRELIGVIETDTNVFENMRSGLESGNMYEGYDETIRILIYTDEGISHIHENPIYVKKISEDDLNDFKYSDILLTMQSIMYGKDSLESLQIKINEIM